MPRAGGPVLLALVLVLAGCGGFAGDRPATATETVTPAPVPEGPSARGQVAPGLAASAADPPRLARAHAAKLRNVSFTLWHNETVRYENGTVRWTRTVAGDFEANVHRYRIQVAVGGLEAGPGPSEATYFYDGRRVVRTVDLGNTSYRRLVTEGAGVGAEPAGPIVALPFDPFFRTRIRTMFAGGRVTGVEERHPEFVGTSDTMFLVRGEFDGVEGRPVSNGSFRALVDRDGVVRSFRLSYSTVRDGVPVRVTERLNYANVGWVGGNRVRGD